MEWLLYATIVSTVGGIIISFAYMRHDTTKWALRMDYRQQVDSAALIKAKLGVEKAIALQQLKTPSGSGLGDLGNLANIDLDQVQDIIEGLKGGGEEGEGGGILKLLRSPLVSGLIKGAAGGVNKDKESDYL